MKHQNTPADEAHENDRVWELINQAKPRQPSGRFVDDTVRAARLSGQCNSWSAKSWAFRSLSAGLLGATAALVISLLPDTTPNGSTSPVAIVDSPRAQEIQEIAETETLIAAVEHMDEFSDTELVTLIGF